MCSGAQSFGSGFVAADARCKAELAGSVVCNSHELIESIRAGVLTELPTAAWYNNSDVIDVLRWSNTFTSPAWPLACCK